MAERVLALLRWLAALLVSAVLGALVWLIVVEEERFVPESLDFNHLLGELALGPGHASKRGSGPLAVVGDPVAPTGFLITCGFGLVLALLHMTAIEPLLRRVPVLGRSVLLRALPVALIAYLAWGLVFTSLVSDRLDVDAGPFGVDSSAATPITYAFGAYLMAVVLVRSGELIRTAAWWRSKEIDQEAALRDATGGRG